MTTTVYAFTPNQTSAFQFQPTLDGTVYNCVVSWNLYGQRYYLTVYTLKQLLVVNIPLIGSPPGGLIDLLVGYFASTLGYFPDSGILEVTS